MGSTVTIGYGVAVAMNLVDRTICPVRGAASGKEGSEQRPVCRNGGGNNSDTYFDTGPDGEVNGGKEEVPRR